MTDVLQKVTEVVDNSKGFFQKLKDLIVEKENQISALVTKVNDFEERLFNLSNEKEALENIVELVYSKFIEMEEVLKDLPANAVEKVKAVEETFVGTLINTSAPEVVVPVVPVVPVETATQDSTVLSFSEQTQNASEPIVTPAQEDIHTVDEPITITPFQ